MKSPVDTAVSTINDNKGKAVDKIVKSSVLDFEGIIDSGTMPTEAEVKNMGIPDVQAYM